MAANVESMFYVREKPWHGLGTMVKEAPTSADALVYAGLDWQVLQKDVYSEDGSQISGYKVNVRNTDNAALGIVSDRYKVVQNEEALHLPMICWVKVLLTKPPDLCRVARRSGCWRRCPTAILLPGMKLRPIWW